MKENKASTIDHQCCPLCGSDEYLMSGSGSLLCAECGSFFENVHQVISSETLHVISAVPIYFSHSSLMN